MRLRRLGLALLMGVAACNPSDLDERPRHGTLGPYEGHLLNDVVRASLPLQPLVGGTIAALSSGWVAVADPDRSRILAVDVDARRWQTIPLPAESQPFRVAEHPSGRVSVSLRGTGQIATFRPGGAVELRAVCDEPRGVAWDEWGQRLLVACAGGELMALPDTGGGPTLVARLPPDLRDIVVSSDVLRVSHFRRAEVLELPRDRPDAYVLRRLRGCEKFGYARSDVAPGAPEPVN